MFRKYKKWLAVVGVALLVGIILAVVLPSRVSVKAVNSIVSISLGSSANNLSVGEVLAERTRASATYYLGDNKYSLDTSIGAAHYQDSNGIWQNIDNTFVPTVAPWNWQMIGDDYHIRVKNDFTAGQIIEFEKQGSTLYFQPMALEWTNNLDQIQQISMPQNVTPAITNPTVELLPDIISHSGTIEWANSYGQGIDFQWQCTPSRLIKILEVESLAKLPVPAAYIISGGNPVMRLNLIFSPSADVDVYVNGALWDKKTKIQTFNIIRFDKKTGGNLWNFMPLRYWDSSENNTGQSVATLEKSGNNLYVSIRVPYSWLQTAIYPIFIDPTVEVFPTDYRYFHADAWDGDKKWLLDEPDGVAPASSNVSCDSITLRAAGASATGTTSVTPSQPTGTLTDDVLVAFILDHSTSNAQSTAPTGWQGRGYSWTSGRRFQVFTAVKGKNSLSGTSWQFTGLTSRSQGMIIGYYNADTTGYGGLDTSVSVRSNAAGTYGTLGITTVTNNAMVIGAFGSFVGSSTATWSAEHCDTIGNLTERFDARNSTYCFMAVADLLLTTANTTGESGATPTTAQNNGGILLALRPITTKLIQGFASENITSSNLSAGHWGFYLWGNHDGTTLVASLFAEVRTSNSTGTLLATSTSTMSLNATETEYYCYLDLPQTVWVSGNKVWVGISANVTTTETGKKVYFYYDHSTRLSRAVDPTIDTSIAIGADDGQSGSDGSFAATLTSNIIGQSTGVIYDAWYRFTGITIPQSSTIGANTTISLVEVASSSSALTNLYADDQNNPTACANQTDHASRTRTTNFVAWDGDPGVPAYYSKVITDVIQELVTSYDYSNEAIQILHDDDGSANNKYQSFYAIEKTGGIYKALLHIEYTAGGVPAITDTPASINFNTVNITSTYWAYGGTPPNPITDSYCTFTVTNSGTGSVNITAKATNFTGGVGWTLGTPDTTHARLSVYQSGANTTSQGLVLTTSEQGFISALTQGGTKKWEIKLDTPTDYTDSTIKTSTVTLTATAS